MLMLLREEINVVTDPSLEWPLKTSIPHRKEILRKCLKND